jgi:hypothetical protein
MLRISHYLESRLTLPVLGAGSVLLPEKSSGHFCYRMSTPQGQSPPRKIRYKYLTNSMELNSTRMAPSC